MNILNAVKTIFSNPFNAKKVTQFSIPTNKIHTPAHQSWHDWREQSCRETWCDGLEFEDYHADCFSESDYILIDVSQLKDDSWQVVAFVDYHKPDIRGVSEPEFLWQFDFKTEPMIQDIIAAVSEIDGGLEITELYRNDCDPCAQTNEMILEQMRALMS